jgi:hypothetical protein
VIKGTFRPKCEHYSSIIDRFEQNGALFGEFLLMEQVERAREGFSATLGDTTTLTTTHESELAALVLRCMELQLYQDALDLCALLPHLPGPSQALLRDRVVGELRVFKS